MITPKKTKTIFTISKVAQTRGIKNPHQLHLKTGISFPRSKKLWSSGSKINLEDINILCERLSCEVNDLIARVPEKPHLKIKITYNL